MEEIARVSMSFCASSAFAKGAASKDKMLTLSMNS